MKKDHSIVINKPVYLAEEGLLLGNGDFSVSCYQKPGKIVFQLGKSDFWDRRIDFSQNPKPANIEELKKLIEKGATIDGVTFQLKGNNITEREREICKSFYSQKCSAPMPKRAGNLYIHIPADWHDCTWLQKLDMENGELTIEYTNYDGAKFILSAVIHPELNQLAIKWKLENYTDENIYNCFFHGFPNLPLVYATCFREKELSITEFAEKELLEHGCRYFQYVGFPSLPAAQIKDNVLEQINPDGGKLFLALSGDENTNSNSSDSFLRQLPQRKAMSGEFFVGISTDSREDALKALGDKSYKTTADLTAIETAKFMSKSEVDLGDDFLNKCFYGSLYAKKCVLKANKLPPGLFMPSTLLDYAQWKGDFHMNYNYQSIFLGDYETNHIETGDAYFEGIKSLVKLGEKISRDYYNIDGGCFIQLCGYPIDMQDDCYGYLPLGRMAYMTGWVAAYFYRRWKLTMDKKFLVDYGYPALKKFAIFYENFLHLGNDGYYHSYPSNQGESEFSRAGAYDKMQVLMHGAFALHAAADAANVLGLDKERAEKWHEISQKIPQVTFMLESGNYPEFSAFDGVVPQAGELPDFFIVGNRFHDAYFGQMPYKFSIFLRSGVWQKDTWYADLLKFLKRWELPNGMLRAMTVATHNYRGGWTESLGIVGALADMLMFSINGTVKIFQGIPEKQSASFKNLRADGAFLISAEKGTNEVKSISIFAEVGGTIKIENPWFPKKCQVNYSNNKQEIFTEQIFVLTMDKNMSAELAKG